MPSPLIDGAKVPAAIQHAPLLSLPGAPPEGLVWYLRHACTSVIMSGRLSYRETSLARSKRREAHDEPSGLSK